MGDDEESGLCPGGKPCVRNGLLWGCAQCTPTTQSADCGASTACRSASCGSNGQCETDNAAELTVCPRPGTWEGYCRSGDCRQASDASGSSMGRAEQLRPGRSLWSPNGTWQLLYQNDGNLTVWKGNPSGDQFRWCLFNTSQPAGALILQPDGNLVIWVGENRFVWDSLSKAGRSGSTLQITNEGRVMLGGGELVGDYHGALF